MREIGIFAGIAFGTMMFNAGFSLHIAIAKGSYVNLLFRGTTAAVWGYVMVWNGLIAMRKAS